MQIKTKLNKNADLAIIAVRFNPIYNFNGFVKKALLAELQHTDYHLEIQSNTVFVPCSLTINLHLNEQYDKDLIDMLKNVSVKGSFIKSVVAKHIDVNYMDLVNNESLMQAIDFSNKKTDKLTYSDSKKNHSKEKSVESKKIIQNIEPELSETDNKTDTVQTESEIKVTPEITVETKEKLEPTDVHSDNQTVENEEPKLDGIHNTEKPVNTSGPDEHLDDLFKTGNTEENNTDESNTEVMDTLFNNLVSQLNV